MRSAVNAVMALRPPAMQADGGQRASSCQRASKAKTRIQRGKGAWRSIVEAKPPANPSPWRVEPGNPRCPQRRMIGETPSQKLRRRHVDTKKNDQQHRSDSYRTQSHRCGPFEISPCGES